MKVRSEWCGTRVWVECVMWRGMEIVARCTIWMSDESIMCLEMDGLYDRLMFPSGKQIHLQSALTVVFSFSSLR